MFREYTHSDEQAHHVSSGDVVHDEVEAVTVLEGVVEAYDPLVVCLCQDVTLCLHMSHLQQKGHSFELDYIHNSNTIQLQNINAVISTINNNLSHLIAIEDIFLAQCFHGIKCTSVHLTCQTHFSKRSYTQRLDFNKHGFVHFGTAQPVVVGLFLVKHLSHLLLLGFRQTSLERGE